jgi:hypothetical protein
VDSCHSHWHLSYVFLCLTPLPPVISPFHRTFLLFWALARYFPSSRSLSTFFYLILSRHTLLVALAGCCLHIPLATPIPPSAKQIAATSHTFLVFLV